MKKGWKILGWCVSIFCFLSVFMFGFHFSSLLFLIVGVAVLPVSGVQKQWERLLKGKKWIKNSVLVLLFLVACIITPTDNIQQDTPSETRSIVEDVNAEAVADTVDATVVDADQAEVELQEAGEEKSETEKMPDEEGTPDNEVVDALSEEQVESFSLKEIPAYSGTAYTVVHENVPYFTSSDLKSAKISYVLYSDFDSLGRCGVCIANVGPDLLPTEERGEIGDVRPTGWQTVKYNEIIDGNYLYNRCHLIAYQLAGENDKIQNLITGTRYLNVEGMLPFESEVADYVGSTGNHVLYRVTPIFEGDNLVASGVLMEAQSVEDDGEGVRFNVFCYNVQPGISIDYANGDSTLDGTILVEAPVVEATKTVEQTQAVEATPVVEPTPAAEPSSGLAGGYAVNAKNGKIHIVGKCQATGTGEQAMKQPVYFDTYEEAENYSAGIESDPDKRKCKNCWK